MAPELGLYLNQDPCPFITHLFRIWLSTFERTAWWDERQLHAARTYGVAAFVILLLTLLIVPNGARQLEVLVCNKFSHRAALNIDNEISLW